MPFSSFDLAKNMKSSYWILSLILTASAFATTLAMLEDDNQDSSDTTGFPVGKLNDEILAEVIDRAEGHDFRNLYRTSSRLHRLCTQSCQWSRYYLRTFGDRALEQAIRTSPFRHAQPLAIGVAQPPQPPPASRLRDEYHETLTAILQDRRPTLEIFPSLLFSIQNFHREEYTLILDNERGRLQLANFPAYGSVLLENAVYTGSLPLITRLEALGARDHGDRVLQTAMRVGQISILEHIFSRTKYDHPLAVMLKRALEENDSKVIAFLCKQDVWLSAEGNIRASLLPLAAAEGHVEVIQWLMGAHPEHYLEDLPYMAENAAKEGRREVLIHLLDLDRTFAEQIPGQRIQLQAILLTALASGHLNVVEYLLANESSRLDLADRRLGSTFVGSRPRYSEPDRQRLLELFQEHGISFSSGVRPVPMRGLSPLLPPSLW